MVGLLHDRLGLWFNQKISRAAKKSWRAFIVYSINSTSAVRASEVALGSICHFHVCTHSITIALTEFIHYIPRNLQLFILVQCAIF